MPTMNGTIVGNPAGAYAYFVVNYPGQGADVRIQLTMGSYNASLSAGLGFWVYGGNGFVGRGEWQSDGYLELAYGADEPTALLVQVYNYYDLLAVPYSIVATGLPASQPVAQATPAATVAAVTTSNLETNTAGAIVGSHAGAFGKYTLKYAGDSADVKITMTFTPDDPSLVGAVGFQVYDPDGVQVAAGVPTSDTPGVHQATFASAKAGTYTVQVYDYVDGLTLNYALTVTQ